MCARTIRKKEEDPRLTKRATRSFELSLAVLSPFVPLPVVERRPFFPSGLPVFWKRAEIGRLLLAYSSILRLVSRRDFLPYGEVNYLTPNPLR